MNRKNWFDKRKEKPDCSNFSKYVSANTYNN